MKSIYILAIGLELSGCILLAQPSSPISYLQDQAISAAVEAVAASPKEPAMKASALAAILNNSQSPAADRISSAKALVLMNDDAGIRSLIDNIQATVQSESGTKLIAVDALVMAGDKVVPDLLKYIDQTGDKKGQAAAVETIVKIKGDKYQEFVESKKGDVSPKVLDALLRFGITD
ncbi:MAG TPA: hypothetical protein PLS03_02855 [Terrimicrobiaceae bacterium]|nr:hypothetical protein [Terrimicrobiaceae bacterium]